MLRVISVVCCMALMLSTAPVFARVTIKLGTLAPDGSSWHLLLKEMGSRWHEASGGEVKLKIFAGGVAGNEGDMVRKMRIGQLQAAALTVVGLGDIEPSPQAISSPGLIADDAEWNHVFGKMQPIWERLINEKGFVVAGWGDTGWVHLFSKKPIRTPQEMKGMKVFAWAGDPDAIKAWKLAGFQPVVLSATDILPSLSTGMIEGYATTPIMAMNARWYERTPYMTEAQWAHLPGATVVRKKTWDKIPSELQQKLMAIAQEYATKVNTEVTRMQADAVTVMKKNGLKLIQFDAAGHQEWAAMAARAWPGIRGGVVTEAAFDQVLRVRDDYRAQK